MSQPKHGMTLADIMLSQTASARWKRRNKAHVTAKLKEWLHRNRDRRRTYNKERYARLREQIREYDSKRYRSPNNVAKRLANRRKRKTYNAEYRRKNPQIGRHAHAKRKALKRGNSVGDPMVILAWAKLQKSRKLLTCFWCLRKRSMRNCHFDHIIPLNKGGSHSIENICISCADCNRSKHDKTLKEWNLLLLEPTLF